MCMLAISFGSVETLPRLGVRIEKGRDALRTWFETHVEHWTSTGNGGEERFYFSPQVKGQINVKEPSSSSYPLPPPQILRDVKFFFEARELWNDEGWAQTVCTVRGDAYSTRNFARGQRLRQDSVHAIFRNHIQLDRVPPAPFITVTASDAGMILLLEHRLHIQQGIDIVHRINPLWGVGPSARCDKKFSRYENAYTAAVRHACSSSPDAPGYIGSQAQLRYFGD